MLDRKYKSYISNKNRNDLENNQTLAVLKGRAPKKEETSSSETITQKSIDSDSRDTERNNKIAE